MPEIMTRIGPKLLAELDEIAKTMEVTRAETVRQILRLGLDSIYDMAEDEDEKDESECDECGADVPNDAKFCPACGIEFEDDDEDSEEDDEDEDEDSEEDVDTSKED